MKRAEFIHQEILGYAGKTTESAERRVRMAVELAETLEKSGKAPWDDIVSPTDVVAAKISAWGAVRIEREACAKIADSIKEEYGGAPRYIAIAIRARAEKNGEAPWDDADNQNLRSAAVTAEREACAALAKTAAQSYRYGDAVAALNTLAVDILARGTT